MNDKANDVKNNVLDKADALCSKLPLDKINQKPGSCRTIFERSFIAVLVWYHCRIYPTFCNALSWLVLLRTYPYLSVHIRFQKSLAKILFVIMPQHLFIRSMRKFRVLRRRRRGSVRLYSTEPTTSKAR